MNTDDYQRALDKLEARDRADAAEAVQLLRDIRDAVRELKPAPSFPETPNDASWRDRAKGAEFEIERLEKIISDQALVIKQLQKRVAEARGSDV